VALRRSDRHNGGRRRVRFLPEARAANSRRLCGAASRADVVVAVPPGRAVIEGHAAADEVEQAVERALPNSDVVVHIEPRRRGLTLRDRVLAIALSDPAVSEAHDITIFEHGDQVSVSLHLKLLADSTLRAAHDVAERVEDAIRALPPVSDVRTHLEPLERAHAADPTATRDDHRTVKTIRAIVHDQTGAHPHDVRLLPTETGSVLFITVPVGRKASLADAHQIASDLEEALRQRLPEIADVVVHTEPGGPPESFPAIPQTTRTRRLAPGSWVGRQPVDHRFLGPPRVRDPRVSCACVAASSSRFPGQAIRTASTTTRWPSTHRSHVMRKVGAARPAWWATSAVPYRYFWLLPSAGVAIGLAAASAFGVPVWLGFICAETPALALEAWWRHARPPSGDTP
jgi:divalent metal cation (Fe/Co/Zn/Cd) transporter